MKLQFSVDYRTQWGQQVAVELTLQRAKGAPAMRMLILDTHDGYTWHGECTVTERDVKSFSYRYCILEGDNVVRREWNGVERWFPADATRQFIFPDHWRDIPALSHLYSSAYSRCVSQFQSRRPELGYFGQTLIFRVQAPQLRRGQALAIIGSQPPLGSWTSRFALPMQPAGTHEWVISLSAQALTFPFEYKYVIIDAQSGELVAWEEGENRRSPHLSMESNTVLCVWDKPLRMPDEHWKAAGVVIPVFSLRSDRSQGVGDFGDLARMADWAHHTGMSVIQILPIYDTTQTHEWTDSYPYNSISIYALHPQYIDLSQLPAIDDAAYMQQYEQQRLQLNALPQIDYVAMDALKQGYLRRLYAQEGARITASTQFEQFCADNDDWIVPYAVFCHLRDTYHTGDFSTWPVMSQYNAAEVRRFARSNAQEVNYYMFVQYLLDSQLTATCDYARNLGVLLKGDIPIGISRTSVEAWTEPHYFHMDGQAGAPPDDFSMDGQNWGFPTYDWERMSQDGYQWWVRRFLKMARYFDAYRIDHVLGFFRIWEIPMHSVHGLLGHFSPSLPMTVSEIESYGLRFHRELYTQPYITDDVLAQVFASRAQAVARQYLVPAGRGFYDLKPEYATQRLVQQAFAGTDPDDAEAMALRDGLYSLISNVLFVPDPRVPDTYHPRICAALDLHYQYLSQSDQQAFVRLHDDYYFHRHNDFWYTEAMKKLPTLLDATQMLVCAEDLGMVPACVGPVMNELRMLSLEIQAMPKQMGVTFGRLEENPYRSVATIFTHDMSTLRGWWEEDPERTQRYYNEMLQKDGTAPAVMPGWLCEEVIARHLFSPSMLCLISLQDWLGMDEQLRYPDVAFERINIPANPRHYWRYRMHLRIEDLMQATDFNARIRTMIERGGRL